MILKGGRLICPVSNTNAFLDIRIQHGVIVETAPTLLPEVDESVHDCKGLMLLPGFVDFLGFCGLPNASHREDLSSFSSAAVAGGYTSA